MSDPINRMLEQQITTLEANLNKRLDATEGNMSYRLDRQDRALGRIEGKVDKTNGRVTTLELWRARAEGLRAAFHWLPALLSGLLCAAVTAAVTILLTAH